MINLKNDRAVINILGEVCWGFRLEDFEIKIGASFIEVESLLEGMLHNSF